MNHGGSDENNNKEKNHQDVLSHQEGIEEAAEQEKSKCQHRHGQHHQPLRIEDTAFEKEGGKRPEEGDEAENVKSDGNGSHFS